jgi:hypothetical protein
MSLVSVMPPIAVMTRPLVWWLGGAVMAAEAGPVENSAICGDLSRVSARHYPAARDKCFSVFRSTMPAPVAAGREPGAAGLVPSGRAVVALPPFGTEMFLRLEAYLVVHLG